MKLTINLTWDTIRYDKDKMEGVLSENLFGCDNFTIAKFEDGGFEIDFWNDEDGYVWTYECYFTDHDHLLHVVIGEEK